MNGQISALPKYPTLRPLPKGIYRLTTTKVAEVKALATFVQPYAGSELESAMQNIVLVLYQYDFH
jgi:hypothetical protein